MNSLSLHRRDEALKPSTECTMGTGAGAGRGPAGRAHKFFVTARDVLGWGTGARACRQPQPLSLCERLSHFAARVIVTQSQTDLASARESGSVTEERQTTRRLMYPWNVCLVRYSKSSPTWEEWFHPGFCVLFGNIKVAPDHTLSEECVSFLTSLCLHWHRVLVANKNVSTISSMQILIIYVLWSKWEVTKTWSSIRNQWGYVDISYRAQYVYSI